LRRTHVDGDQVVGRESERNTQHRDERAAGNHRSGDEDDREGDLRRDHRPADRGAPPSGFAPPLYQDLHVGAGRSPRRHHGKADACAEAKRKREYADAKIDADERAAVGDRRHLP
jgi:hypothetical protein